MHFLSQTRLLAAGLLPRRTRHISTLSTPPATLSPDKEATDKPAGTSALGSKRNLDSPIWKTVAVKAVGEGSRLVAEAGTHKIATDEPHAGNTAATPMQTLLAALAGCEQATAVYLARKVLKMNIESIQFDLTGDYDVRAILGVQGVPARYQVVRGTALVKTDASDAQVQALGQMVPQHCPVASLFKDAGVRMEVVWKKA